ncbi:MAG: PQQ-dependent sugar dehydrogenase [Planctomycetota bacterium]|nr:PQQ-dependent sugar dehydrogenase [Planctomycetota bacterium]
MKSPLRALLVAVVALLLAPLAARAAELSPVTIEPAFPNVHLGGALYLDHPRDGSDRIVVVQQSGQISLIDNDPKATPRPMADLRDRIRAGGEEGLLGLAFHPDFKRNRQLFLHFTAIDMPRRGIIARFTMDPSLQRIDPASQEILLTIPQPYSNHNGGMIAFGPDGMLYIGLGDGGNGGDPHNNGQNKNTLLGKILRIDVDKPEAGRAYAIPADNPFVGQPGVRGEIWALGLRNPWRFSFDRKTGDLWAGDVGQNLWEEIDLIKKGENYGWNVFEGSRPFRAPGVADAGPFTPPIVDYSHNAGVCVTGGYVYRGKKIPALEGAYLYGDFGRGTIWAIHYEPGKPVKPMVLGNVPALASFGEDRDGEVYIVSLQGTIFRFAPRE